MFHRGTGRSAQSAGRAMEDTHPLPSLQCTGTAVLGITPRSVRDISEDGVALRPALKALKMLIQQLRDLEKDGVVHRKV